MAAGTRPIAAKGSYCMASVYLETTIPSYLAAYPSRDLIIAAHQQITHDWWRDARDRFDLYISEAVLNEIRVGDADAAARRLEFVEGLPVLELNDDVRNLVHEYDERLGLLERGRADLPHFAFAVGYEMDYLVTWNCRHIANATMRSQIERVCRNAGYEPAIICTPDELMETDDENTNE